jgi:lipoprotein-releasing system permease protein
VRYDYFRCGGNRFQEGDYPKGNRFCSDIQLVNLDSNRSFETAPVERDQTFVPALKSLPGVRHVQAFGIKAGLSGPENRCRA